MVIALNGKILETITPAGPEYFTFNLYKTFFADFPQNTYKVYYKQEYPGSLLQQLKREFPLIQFTKVMGQASWTHVGVSAQLTKDKPHIYFSPEHTIPLVVPNETKVVAMIHGLEYRSNKQISKFSLKYIIHPLILKWVCKKSHIVLVPSEYTKNELVKADLTNTQTKIQVIHEGISEAFRTQYPPDKVQEVLNSYDLKEKYLLFVSTLQPRKNVESLIRAFSRARKNNMIDKTISLVLVGKKGWGYESIFETIRLEDLELNVKYLNWVPLADLPILFVGALGYVNFSFEEGFSLTLLEAMAAGVPAAVSDIPTHRELGKDSVIYANPNDISAMNQALEKLVDPSAQKNALLANVYSQKYSWHATAEIILSTFNSLL